MPKTFFLSLNQIVKLTGCSWSLQYLNGKYIFETSNGVYKTAKNFEGILLKIKKEINKL